ncbi:MAG: 23S rRNA (guanosine(2251)-2'-O)-methyltransferase RlmB [Actinobacteria bacterium]|nr:23S rRNA (guanosine(2251)-2'-O)-methyltransferase RlmB [Actinomycetota bacterium]
MADLIEGRNAVVEALRSGLPLDRVMIAEGSKPDAVIEEIRRLAADSGVEVERVSRHDLDKRSPRGAHQGVAAIGRPFPYAELGDVLRDRVGKVASLVVVLDHVTDPGNLGAVIRSVEVAGGDAVVIPRDRAASVSSVVHKASAGAASHLPVVRVGNVAQALETLKQAGYWVAGADERAEQSLWRAPLAGRIALVLGAEGSGLARLTRERCDFLVAIPVSGRVSSLNVAQAASVLAFEWVRQNS